MFPPEVNLRARLTDDLSLVLRIEGLDLLSSTEALRNLKAEVHARYYTMKLEAVLFPVCCRVGCSESRGFAKETTLYVLVQDRDGALQAWGHFARSGQG